MKYLFLFFFLLSSAFLFSQSLVRISGQVLSAEKEDGPVSAAYVQIPTQRMGTIVDQDGQFVLRIPEPSTEDYLLISCIGFEDKKIFIDDFLERKNNIIYLKPSIDKVSEIVIETERKKVKPWKVAKDAIKVQEDHYPKSEFAYEMLYRNTWTEDGEAKRMLESLVRIYDLGYHTEPDDYKSM
jgi:hypothetical protein